MRRNAADAREEAAHGRAGADHAFELGFVAGGLAAARVFDEAADALAQERQADGLLEIIGRALADGFDGGFGGVVRGHQDDIDGGLELDDAAEHFEAGHLRHDEVGEDELRPDAADEVEGFGGTRRGVDRDAFAGERGGEQFEAAGIVVEDDDGEGHRERGETVPSYWTGDWEMSGDLSFGGWRLRQAATAAPIS